MHSEPFRESFITKEEKDELKKTRMNYRLGGEIREGGDEFQEDLFSSSAHHCQCTINTHILGQSMH